MFVTIRAHVHLAHGFDAQEWVARWRAGELIGINEPSPYGYHLAGRYGLDVTFSHDRPESALRRLMRVAVRVILGFDVLHAWRNRKSILAADVVWTHTESQHLGVATVLELAGRRRRSSPKVLAQSVWLFDNWNRMSLVRKFFYRRLITRADILLVLSPVNQQTAQRAFPASWVEFVPFGICAGKMVSPQVRSDTEAVRVLAVGNDRHRDWETLIKAIKGDDRIHLRIVSRTIKQSLLNGVLNAEMVEVLHNDQLLGLYEWADVVVLPLHRNQHASGITVLQESVVRGVPVIATDTGGLRAYFDDRCVCYVEPNSVPDLRSALMDLRNDPAGRLQRARTAQERMGPDGLSSDSYVRLHCDLSAKLLAGASAASHGRTDRYHDDTSETSAVT